MAARELVFDILAIDRASRVFDKVGANAEIMGSKASKGAKLMQGALLGAAVAVAAIGVDSVKTAADMETRMNRLVSTAGESASGVKTVWAGIDTLAGQVGTSVTKLADAMYYVEGGGFHAADALTVLTAVSKGAKVEMADTTEVAKAVVGALADYNMKAGQAATVTNAMLTAVGHGQTSFEDFANAFPKVGSRAAAANVTLNETLSAMSRMTRDGLPAAMAATYLGQTIGHLAAPTGPAVEMMKSLGISVIGVQQAITSGSGHGLGDAIQMLYTGIMNHLTPSGLVAVEMFKKSKGTVSDYQKVLANLPPSMQTTVGALAAMSGGVKGFQGILMLGNDHLKGYKDTLAAVNATTKAGGKNIEGVARQQQSLNGMLDDAKGAWSGVADSIGRQFLPDVKNAATDLNGLLGWMSSHQGSVEKFGKVILGIGAAFLVVKGAMMAYQVVATLVSAWQAVDTVLFKALNLAIDSNALSWIGSTVAMGAARVAAVAWTAAQWLLNVALDANPIGLVVLAIGGLALAFVDAYKHSETFRQGVTRVLDVLKIGFITLEMVGLAVFQALTAVFLQLVDVLVRGAAEAFGWVPGLGPKLRAAADDVEKFKNNANSSLMKIQKSLNLQLNTATAQLAYDKLVANMAKPVTVPVFLKTNYTGGSVNVAGVGRVNVGMRAGGGPVDAGSPYIVGEKGPELIIPRQSGHVVDAAGTQAMSKKGSGAALHIENYYEAKAPAGQVAADLMFRMAHS